MCGVVFVLSDKPLEPQELITMRDQLIHRGPDDGGYLIERTHTEKYVGIAHRRLSILDLSQGGHQPMENEDGSLVLTFNGEIYNYKNLKQELTQLGHRFKTQTDTEVLLKAYEAWGAQAVSKLNGMFAFVIWDRRQQEIFVARDRFGEKPLYYTALPQGGIAFASEIKALLAHPDVTRVPCAQKIQDYVQNTSDFYQTNRTFYEGVYVFPPATHWTIDSVTEKRQEAIYWDPVLISQKKKDTAFEEDVEQFRFLLSQSIEARLNADVTVGSCLSGGLDSSSICSLIGAADYHKTHNFSCFSARFDDDPTLSEGPYIDEVLNTFGFQGHSISPKEDDFLETVQKLYWHQEEPFLSNSMFLQYKVYEKVKEMGTTVMLDGQGADELLAGYHSYFKMYQIEAINERRYGEMLRNTHLFNQKLKKDSTQYEDVKRRYDPQIAFSYSKLFALFGASLVGIKFHKYALRHFLIEGIQHRMLPHILHSADRNSMAHSIETRFPFLDYELADFCLTLKTDRLISEGWTKAILRQAMEGILPAKIQWRADKMGFQAPQDKWMRQSLKNWSYERLFKGEIRSIPGWDESKLRDLWARHQSGEDLSRLLWRWISLSEWLHVNKLFKMKKT